MYGPHVEYTTCKLKNSSYIEILITDDNILNKWILKSFIDFPVNKAIPFSFLLPMFKYYVDLYKFLSKYKPCITGFGSTRRWENVTINKFRVMYKETTTHSIPVEITNDYLHLKIRCLPISMNTGIMSNQ